MPADAPIGGGTTPTIASNAIIGQFGDNNIASNSQIATSGADAASVQIGDRNDAFNVQTLAVDSAAANLQIGDDNAPPTCRP